MELSRTFICTNCISAHLKSLVRTAIHHRHFSHSSLPSCLHSLSPLILRTSSPHTQRRLRGGIIVRRRGIREACIKTSPLPLALSECLSLWKQSQKYYASPNQGWLSHFKSHVSPSGIIESSQLPNGCCVLTKPLLIFLTLVHPGPGSLLLIAFKEIHLQATLLG